MIGRTATELYLDPSLQPGLPVEFTPAPSARTPAEQQTWSAFVQRIVAADEGIWQAAEEQARKAGPAASGALEWLKRNRTAVYVVSGGLFLLALLRRRR